MIKNINESVRNYFQFYENEVLTKIKTIPEVTQKDYWYHWLLTHTEWVVFRWIYFALYMNKNVYPVIFACAWHDLARVNDWHDIMHWPNAIPIVSKLMDMFDDLITNKEKEQVKYAIKYHTGWENPPDYVSACLWDADRCRLAQEWTYKEKFFSTEPWKKIASHNAKDFLKFENKCLWRDENIDKENVIQIDCWRDTPDWIYDRMDDYE